MLTVALPIELLAKRKGGFEPPTNSSDNPQSTARGKITTDKKQTGDLRALPLSYPGVWCRRPDSNRRPRRYER